MSNLKPTEFVCFGAKPLLCNRKAVRVTRLCSCYVQRTLWYQALQPLLLLKEGTSELTAETKGGDRISPKMAVSLPLFGKISTPNGEGCILTPKGCIAST